MNSNSPISLSDPEPATQQSGGVQINFKRVLDRALRLWYLIALSLGITLMTAFLVNRYTTRLFPVRASIIIRESEENAGAKFLYDNSIINPYRNFFNEIYIMKSYPLLQEVVTQLGFEVSFFREGEIVNSEVYDRDFPVKFQVAKSSRMPWGTSMYFTIQDDNTFSLQYVSKGNEPGKHFGSLHFNDTLNVNGFRLFARKSKSASDYIGRKFIIRFNNPLSLAREYSSKLQANWAAPGASVVILDVVGPNADKEVDFLNKFIERYQNYDIDKKNKVATMAMRFLDQQLVATGDSLKNYEDQVEDFKGRNVITGLNQETNRLYQKMQSFEDRKFQYRLNESYYAYISDLMTRNAYEGVFTPNSVGVTDPIVSNLITEIISLQSQVSVYRGNQQLERSVENPMLKSAQQRIAYLKNDVLKAIANNRETEKLNIKFIDEQIALVTGQISKLPSKERELVDIQRNYTLKENLYVFLLQKRTEAGLSKASTTSDIVIVNPPQAGGSITPKVQVNYAIAAGVGISIPLVIFLLLEILNSRVQSKDDIEKICSVPVIGGIGHNGSNDPLVVHTKSRSALAESYRALRSNLHYFTGTKDHQVFMVTSSIPGEGKSFTTLNLACVLAMSGKRTLVLGADLRRPKLYEDLKLENVKGLSQYLSGMASLEDVIQQSSVENLSMISGGPMPPNPSELLIRPAMDKLMLELQKTFDYVVIDTPPLSFVADAFVLSKYAHHTLFVIRQDFTPFQSLQTLEEYYQTGKLSNISILFNDLRKTGLGYGYGTGYGYGYGYSYGYGSKKKNRNGSGYYEE